MDNDNKTQINNKMSSTVVGLIQKIRKKKCRRKIIFSSRKFGVSQMGWLVGGHFVAENHLKYYTSHRAVKRLRLFLNLNCSKKPR